MIATVQKNRAGVGAGSSNGHRGDHGVNLLNVVTDTDNERGRSCHDGASDSASNEIRPMLRSLAGVRPEPLEWIWDGVVPRGKLTMITGETGAGKSLFTLEVIAGVTTGRTKGKHQGRKKMEGEEGEEEMPLTPALSREYLGEGEMDDHCANGSAVADSSFEENAPHPALSPEYRGEGEMDDHRANGVPILNPSSDARRVPAAPILNPSCDARVPPAAAAGAAILFSAGDCLEDTVVPRLISAGADLSKVFVLSNSVFGADDADRANGNGGSNSSSKELTPHPALSPEYRGEGKMDSRRANSSPILNPSSDARKVPAAPILNSSSGARKAPAALEALETIEMELVRLRDEGVDVRLIVIDPIERYLNALGRKTAVFAELIDRLTDLAAKFKVAIVVVANSKPSGYGDSGLRYGSVGNRVIANAARSVWMIAKDLEIDNRRLLIPIKTNLCENPLGKAYEIRKGVVEWEAETVSMNGDEYFNQSKEKLRNPLIREECSEIARVTHWLKDKLSCGRVSSLAVRYAAGEHDIAYSTLRRAFSRLGCKASKEWASNCWKWFWRLPGAAAEAEAAREVSRESEEMV